MIRVPRSLVVHHNSGPVGELVLAAGRADGYAAAAVPGWEEMREALRHSAPLPLALVGAGAEGEARERLADVRRLVDEFPRLSVIVSLPAGAGRRVRGLAAAGVLEVIQQDVEATPAAVSVRLALAREHAVGAAARRFFPPPRNAAEHALRQAVVGAALEGAEAGAVAEALQVDRRTLLRRMEAAGLPGARRLFAWLRLLAAAELLDEPWRTVAGVASLCGYSSDTALRTALQAFVGLPPRQLRERGAFATLRAAFHAELGRPGPRAPGPAARR
jgi:AraC-like DNA-binding protein